MRNFRVYLLVGFFGSGKSTWAKNMASVDSDLVIVNRDSLRTMLYGQYKFRPMYEPMIREIAHDAVNRAAKYGLSVVIDETNLTKKRRAEWLEVVNKAARESERGVHIEVVYFLERDGNVAYRVKGGDRGISIREGCEILKGMKESFEAPESEEFPEHTFHSVVTLTQEKII